MKKFLRYIVLFSLPLVVLCLGVEYMLRQIPNPYTFKRYLLEEKGAGIKNMIIGSSVVNQGVDPSLLPDSTYNLAFSGQFIRYNKAQLEKFIDSLPNLKCIIWGISTQALWADESESGVLFQDRIASECIAYYTIYMDISFDDNWLHHSEFLSSPATIWREKWTKYYLQHKKTMYCDSFGLDHKYDSSEKYEEYKGDMDKWLKDIPVGAKKHTPLHNGKAERIYRQNVRCMDDVARLCHDRGIRLCLVVPPVYQEYCKLISDWQKQQIYSTLGEVAGKWDNVSWYNYFEDLRFVKDDFYNANHLTSDGGAGKFSRILMKDLFGNADAGL